MNCADCNCGLIPQNTWAKADTNQRRQWLAADQRMLQGRGLCRACYLQLHKAGGIPPRTPTREGTPCIRCGIATPDHLCRDCIAVLDDDDLALWRP